jgi:hypothetical protein
MVDVSEYEGGNLVRRWSPTRLSLLFVAVLVLAEALAAGSDHLTDRQMANERQELTFWVMMLGPPPARPVAESNLACPEGADGPLHQFAGSLELLGEAFGSHIRVISDQYGMSQGARGRLPEIELQLVQVSVEDKSYLVPVERGLVVTGSPAWDLIVEPGRVWSEAGDMGYSRASLPFHLVHQNYNCVSNGVLTFLFDDSSISRVWFQITQETCYYYKVDLWGLLSGRYQVHEVADAEQVKSAFQEELASRMPIAPIEQLAVDYPGVDLAQIGSGITSAHMTTYGVVVDGINYIGGCRTRYGVYPYCAEMRAPSYSTAKSLFAGVALMRLTQRYGDQVPELLIEDYVPEASQARGDWSAVTFDNALDMATGHYGSADYMVDDDGTQMSQFFAAESLAEHLALAFDWPYREPPGHTWVYRTSDTFILIRAMERFLQEQEGADADIFDFVVDEVYRPLQVGPGAHSSLRTSDNGWHGQAEGGFGMFWIQDDIAKLSSFLIGGGAVGSSQLLQPDQLAAAMHQHPFDLGPATGYETLRYNNGFWGSYFDHADVPGYSESFWVPRMVGWGGIVVALLPNGVTYYYFSDNHEYPYRAAVTELLQLEPAEPQDEVLSPRRGARRAVSAGY